MPRRRAVVIGGSLAGLLAASVLRSHFSEVVVIEKDDLPIDSRPRRGVPQAHHVHAMLEGGRAALDELLPGFTRDMIAEGAEMIDSVGDALTMNIQGTWALREPAGQLELLSATRMLIEKVVRRRVLALDGVSVRKGSAVALRGNPQTRRIDAVVIRSGEAVAELDADLFVDASGRGSALPRWLEEIGFTRPRETVIDAGWRYASCRYALPPDPENDWKMLSLPASPELPNCSGAIVKVENGEYCVTLKGQNSFEPPTEPRAFLAFADALGSPKMADRLRAGQRLTPIYAWQATANRLRHYDELTDGPHNLLVTGDAVATFNPVYGQGMSLAARDALVLRANLDAASGNGLAERFQRDVAEAAHFPWWLSAGNDARLIGVELDTAWSPGEAAASRFADLRLRAAASPVANLQMMRIVHMLDGIDALHVPEMPTRS